MLKFGARKILALVAVGLIALAAYLAWWWAGLGGLLVVTLATVVVGVGAVAYLVASAERQIRGEMSFFAYYLRDLIVEIEKRSVRPGEQDEALLRALNASYRRLEEELVQRLRHLDD